MRYEVLMSHYRRPEVKNAILSWSTFKENWRLGCAGHKGWYKYSKSNPPRPFQLDQDYNVLIDRLEKNQDRSLYWSLNFNSPESRDQFCYWNKANESWKQPIDYEDIKAYSLGVDIDLLGDHKVTESDSRLKLERASQFLIDKMRDELSGKIKAYFSGNGVYLLQSPGVTYQIIKEKKVKSLQNFLKRFRLWIKKKQDQLYDKFESMGNYVKYDPLTHKNRVFKTILSIHKELDFACIPLSPDKPEIDLDKASLPLSGEIIEKAKQGGYDHE